HLEAVGRRVRQQVQVVGDHRGAVAAEEVHLQPRHAHGLERSNSRIRLAWSSSRLRGVCGASFQSPAELYQTRIDTPLPRAYSTSSASLSSPIWVSHSPSTRV